MAEKRLVDVNSIKKHLTLGQVVLLWDDIKEAPEVTIESLRPESEWEPSIEKVTCRPFRCKNCHHCTCKSDEYCGGCGARMRNAGIGRDWSYPKEDDYLERYERYIRNRANLFNDDDGEFLI